MEGDSSSEIISLKVLWEVMAVCVCVCVSMRETEHRIYRYYLSEPRFPHL